MDNVCPLKGILFLSKRSHLYLLICFSNFLYMTIKIIEFNAGKKGKKEVRANKEICEKIKEYVDQGQLVLSNVFLPGVSSRSRAIIYVRGKESGNVDFSLLFKARLDLPVVGVLNGGSNTIKAFGTAMSVASLRKVIEQCV